MKVMENRTLSLEDIKILVEKVHAAQQVGHCINFDYNNYSIAIHTMIGEFSNEKRWDKHFYMYNSEEPRATYKECIAYLEKLAGEKRDN